MDKLFKALNDPTRRGILICCEKGICPPARSPASSRSASPQFPSIWTCKQAEMASCGKKRPVCHLFVDTSVLDECFAWLLKLKDKKGTPHENH